MNFFEELLDSSQSQLKDEYKLDGTHLHPAYTALMAPFLLPDNTTA